MTRTEAISRDLSPVWKIMSSEAGASHRDWQCAYEDCRKVLPGVPAQTPLPSCLNCRRTQPGFPVDPGPSLPPAPASAWPTRPPGSQASDQSVSGTGAVGGGVFTQPSEGQGSGQYVMITQQQMQEMQRMEARGLPPPPPPPPQHQQISLEQQQLYYQQQLDEKQRKHQQLKQQHSEQLQTLKAMEWNNGQQLGPEQQQQIERQRMWCQRLWNDQKTVLKEQEELWHQFIMLGGINEQQQLIRYEQKLVGVEGQLKQKYEQECEQLKSMELYSHEHQLSYDQQQQLFGQRALCQQLEGDLQIAMNRRQEFQQKFMRGGEFQSGLQTSYGHQQKKVLQPDGSWEVPKAPDQQLQQGPPQHVLWGAENTEWSGGDQQQEDEQRRLQLEQQREEEQRRSQLEQQRQYRENEQWRLTEQQRQHREDEQRRLQLERQRVEEQRLLAEKQQKERELALLDSQQKQLLAEQQKKIEEEKIWLEQQKRLQQQQQRVNVETGGAGQPSHDQQKQDKQQHTQPEQHGGVEQQQQPSHDQQQPIGEEYERSVREQMQAWKLQTGGTSSQQGEGKQVQRPLREEQVSIQIGDAQLENQQQHDQPKAAVQEQEHGEGSDPSHDHQQQPNQEQLAEILRTLKQQYKEELHKLKSMELESSEKQLSHNQQQQLERQKLFCSQLLNKLKEIRQQEKELHGQQLKSMLKVGGGKQLSHGHQSDGGKLGNRHEKHETDGQQLRSEQQGGANQPSHGQQKHDKEQRVQPKQHGGVNQQQGAEQQQPQEPSHDQNQQTVDEYGQSVQQLIDAWQKKSQTEGAQQLSKHPNRQESKQQQRIKQQQEQNIQFAQNPQERYSDHRGQGGDTVYCECGTAFNPNARSCANPNCGKRRPRSQPQGPPCVHCGELLMKKDATVCASCHKKQTGAIMKPSEGAGTGAPTPPGLGQGYGYTNQPQQQPDGVQPHSSAMVVMSTSTLPHTSHSAIMVPVFGNSATIPWPTYATASQPTPSQFHSGENKNLQAAAKGVPGALPSNQGNDGKAVVKQPPGVPGSARPMKDHSASGLHSCTSDPLREGDTSSQNQTHRLTGQEQTTPPVNSNDGKTTSEANDKSSNRTAGAGGEGGGRPKSQLAAHSGSGDAPDPPLDDPGSRVDPKTIAGMSYADAAAKVFHMLSAYKPVLCHDNKNY